jgi:hypothetical protein
MQGRVYLLSCQNNLIPFLEYCKSGQGQYEGDVEREMSKCPNLLSDGTEVLVVEAVEIQHIE